MLVRHPVLQDALDHFGVSHQCGKAVEECGELIVELARGCPSLYDLAGELADVSIMISQVAMGYGIEAEVAMRTQEKLDRLAGTLAAARRAAGQ